MKRSTTILASVISLALSSTSYAASSGKILILLSGSTKLPLTQGQPMTTGYYLNEFGVPADALLKAGYTLQIATPDGKVPQADPHSADTKYFGNSTQEMQRIQTMIAHLPGVETRYSIADALKSDLSQYDGIFIPGGHAPLIDLANNPQVGQLLTWFHQHHKATAALCHGPITLLSAQTDPKAYEAGMIAHKSIPAEKWIYKGYQMTIFSTPEEQAFEGSLKGAKLRYYPADAMSQAGGKMNFGGMWQSHVVVDRELVTGQNPSSANELATQLIHLLQTQSKQGA